MAMSEVMFELSRLPQPMTARWSRVPDQAIETVDGSTEMLRAPPRHPFSAYHPATPRAIFRAVPSYSKANCS